MIALSLLLVGGGVLPGPDALARVRELGCASCHAELAPAGRHPAPDLALAARRLTPRALREHLADPSGTAMPDLLGGLAPAERARAVEELAAYLGSMGDGVALVAGAEGGEAARGERLYHEVGCVPCHGARRGEGGAAGRARDLDRVGARSTPDGLADLLLRPLEHRPSGRMPGMHLTRGEAADLARYLAMEAGDAAEDGAGSPGARERDAEGRTGTVFEPGPEAELVARGERRYRELGCAACHAGAVEAPAPVRVDARAHPSRGCLADDLPPGVPDYGLEATERARLRAVVGSMGRELAPVDRLAVELVALGCTACHERAGLAGPDPDHERWFGTDEPELGDAARLPPPLDGVGARLRRPWLERVLAEGGGVRPALHARMPRFGEAATAGLAELLIAVDLADRAPGAAAPEDPLAALPAGDLARELRDGGRALLGTGGLACITCHRWNGTEALAFQGPDLVGTYDRLRPEWFRAFLLDPEAFRPGIVMPSSWPDGVAVHREILGGDTERQLDALWYTLSLGTSAPRPEGLDPPEWRLDAVDGPVVYRGRSGVAGFRGIAIGSPLGLHLAFDAETGALAGLWRGEFVRLAWNGQGAGDFSPRARFHPLARDLAFLAEEASRSAWPLRPRTTREAPVDPDPTYPWRHGYRFLGYHLDEEGAPTLRYRVAGAVRVEDRPRVVEGPGGAELVRTLVLESEEPRRLVLRALAGGVEARGEGRYAQGAVELELPAELTTGARLRPFEPAAEEPAAGTGGEELLVELAVPVGRREVTLRYRLLDGEGGR